MKVVTKISKRTLVLLALWLILPQHAVCAADAVVVRPSGWTAALETWRVHRAAQGMEVAEIDAELTRDEIQLKIKQLHQESEGRLRFVLLAGDVGVRREISVPTFYRNSKALVQFGGDRVIATDNPYGDLDGDEIPELAVGRIPADSAAQLADYLQRVIDYELKPDYSSWRRDVHVVAGVGGFGLVADSVIEMTTRRFLADRIPGWSEVSMTQASTQSHYCPDPWRFSEACIAKFNQGGMFWVYIGHGSVTSLDRMRVENELLPILNHQHVPAIDVQSRPPIAIFLACYTGAFDALDDSLAEELVLSPGGPIAAIAASRVSGPYGLAMLSNGLLEGFYVHQEPTFGAIVLAAKKGILQETDVATHNTQLQMIGQIAAALSPKDYDLRAEREEHVWQMHLLGDPMMRLSHPGLIHMEMPARAAPGETISVAGTSSDAGRLCVEFAYCRDHVRRELNEVTGDLHTQTGRDLAQLRYEAANDRILVSHQSDCSAGPFAIQLTVPDNVARGKFCVRAFVEGQTGWQVGYSEISIRPPQ